MRLAIDIGGTFSDIVLLDEGGVARVSKSQSTPDDYSRGVLAGVTRLLAESGVDAASIDAVIHSTTVGTNTVLQRSGEPACLITTAGFRDVLELGRIRLPVLYNLRWSKPLPLIRRAHRLEVEERVSADGTVLRALEPDSVARAIEHVRKHRIRSVAICLLNAYVNAVHERRVAEALREAIPDCTVSLSHEVLPEIQEFERTSTTVADAYIKRSVSTYLDRLDRGLRELGIPVPMTVMHSNGGMLSLRSATRMPVVTVESGPAAGVVGTARLAAALGIANAISFDMGGTTAKASLVEDGRILRSSEYEVGGEISASSRLIKGSGYLIRIPVIDVSEVGNGGGSYVRSAMGRLQVGPSSAGAVPGPACYGIGNDLPTVTDANVVLVYLHPERLTGGDVRIEHARAMAAIRDHVATPLGLSIEAAAHGVHLLAVSNMMRAVRNVSVERGRDPRDFTLFAFGGNGPLHAVSLARTLGIQRIIVPAFAGLFSSVGLLAAGFELSFVQSSLRPLDGLETILHLQRSARQQAIERYREGGNPTEGCEVEVAADVRYRGQSSYLTIPVDDGEEVSALTSAFHAEHRRTFGYGSIADPVELVSFRVTVRGPVADVPWHALGASALPAPSAPNRRVYFGSGHGWIDTPVIERRSLGPVAAQGPVIIEEYDSTTLVPPCATARLDELANICIGVGDDERI